MCCWCLVVNSVVQLVLLHLCRFACRLFGLCCGLYCVLLLVSGLVCYVVVLIVYGGL